ncbi:DUF4176 domain-containing protein [Oceanobacillus senegalensis]|uniref:DUF4176 domain-containing protein n=1 Tax=Oceanobacillus senegalensis TaxID=1936063 RepID=UPI000A3123AC|nr:DUF4176 domain-containing protein [Oceanobacillus senegalensis]
MEKDFNSLKIDKGTALLPIGSVVTLDIVGQAVMIYGRKQKQANNESIWDYVACPYPQGHISDDTNVFFNHDQIKDVVFKGLETEGEIKVRKELERLMADNK